MPPINRDKSLLCRTKLLRLLKYTLALVFLLTFSFHSIPHTMAGTIYDKLLFYPTKQMDHAPQSVRNIAREEYYIRSHNGNKIHAWYYEHPQARGVALVSHGNAGNISHRTYLVELMLDQQLSVLVYDYQGYGMSEGTPTTKNVCEDGIAAYEFLIKEKSVEPEKIVLYGESLGGGISCHIADSNKCAAIILQSTFSSLPSVGKKVFLVFRAVPKFLHPKIKLDNAAILSKKHAPVLIMHGTEDEVIPFSEAERLNSKAIEPKKFVPIKRSGHNNIQIFELKEAISEFLQEYLK